EPVLELESGKVALEVYASAAGRLDEIRAPAGTTVEVGAVLGTIAEGAGAATDASPAAAPPAPAPAPPSPAKAPAAPPAPQSAKVAGEVLAPSVRKIAAEANLDVSGATGSGKDGRLTKADAQALAEIARETRKAASTPGAAPAAAPPPAAPRAPHEREERVRMSRLRKR